MRKADSLFAFTINPPLAILKKPSLKGQHLGRVLRKFFSKVLSRCFLKDNRPIFTDAINNTGLATVTYLNSTQQQVREKTEFHDTSQPNN